MVSGVVLSDVSGVWGEKGDFSADIRFFSGKKSLPNFWQGGIVSQSFDCPVARGRKVLSCKRRFNVLNSGLKGFFGAGSFRGLAGSSLRQGLVSLCLNGLRDNRKK